MKISPQSYPHLSLDVNLDKVANGDEIVVGGHNFPVVRTIHDATTGASTVIVAKTALRVEVQSTLNVEIEAIQQGLQAKVDAGTVNEVDVMFANDEVAKLGINEKVETELIKRGFKPNA